MLNADLAEPTVSVPALPLLWGWSLFVVTDPLEPLLGHPPSDGITPLSGIR